jgi:hypothetical protein
MRSFIDILPVTRHHETARAGNDAGIALKTYRQRRVAARRKLDRRRNRERHE